MNEKPPDNQNFFRALFWAMLVFLIWTTVAGPLLRPKTEQEPTAGKPDTAQVDTPGATKSPGSRDELEQGELKAIGGERRIVTLGDDAHEASAYRMNITLDPKGAAIDTVLLSDHRERVGSDHAYCLLKPIEIERPDKKIVRRSLAIERITIDGKPIRLDTVDWEAHKQETSDSQVARFIARIEQNGQPIIELERTYTLEAQEAQSLHSDLEISLQVRNLTDQPHDIILTSLGPMGLTKQGRFGTDRKIYAATRDETGIINANPLSFSDVTKSVTRKAYSHAAGAPLIWHAAGNLYFTCTLAPVDDQGQPATDYIDEIIAFDLDKNADTPDEVTSRIRTRKMTLPPQGEITLRTDAYLGPKDRDAFTTQARYAERQYMLQITDNYGSCTFSFLIKWMIGLLNWLEGIIPNYGVAIILLVVIVRALLHPITKKTQINMVKMQQNMGKLQPKVDEVKRKYAGDNRKMQEELMKVYREEGINPLGQMMSCLPMLLQMPIWIALYSSLNNNVAMRGRGFVGWIQDLTAPDCLIHFSKPVTIPIMGTLECFSLLPILVGVFMFAQQKLMPKPKKPPSTGAKSPQADQAEQMQKIMPYMSLVMVFIFYGFPSGLNLYIMTSSIIGTAEQIYIRKHIKDYEAKEKQGLIKKKPRRPLPGQAFLERLQKHAEQARKVQSSRQKPKR